MLGTLNTDSQVSLVALVAFIGHEGALRSATELHTELRIIAHCCLANDTSWCISLDHISNVSDALIIKCQISEVRLAGIDQNSQQLEDSFLALALGEGAHGGLDQIELLLQIVEADLCIETVPVEHLVVNERGRTQMAVD